LTSLSVPKGAGVSKERVLCWRQSKKTSASLRKHFNALRTILSATLKLLADGEKFSSSLGGGLGVSHLEFH